jgi:hypothetical protein
VTDEQMKAAVELTAEQMANAIEQAKMVCRLEHGVPFGAGLVSHDVSRALLACAARLTVAEAVIKKAREARQCLDYTHVCPPGCPNCALRTALDTLAAQGGGR